MMVNILIITGAVLVIGFILWWFFGNHKTTEKTAAQTGDEQIIEIVVDGGYTPNTVILKKDLPATITFNRKDSSNCFDEVVFPDFGIHTKLPTDQSLSLEIATDKPGEYVYSCGMNMFHGKVVIK